MRITDIVWKERFVEKLESKHGVTPTEAEEALHANSIVRKVTRGHVQGEDVYAAMAQIGSGRYLIVFFINKKHGVALPISARDMDASERNYYDNHR